MAIYDLAFPIVINAERLVITDTTGDRGGLSAAGISFVNFPKDPIFEKIKELGLKPGQWHDSLTPMAYAFYLKNFWNRIHGNDIAVQEVANTMFSEALVNGVKPAIKDMLLGSGATDMEIAEADGEMTAAKVEIINNPRV